MTMDVRDQSSTAMENVIVYLRARNFAILDCELIQTTPDHQCVRSLYILCKDGVTSMGKEFFACKKYRELEMKYRKSFRYCQRHIHHLSYEPRKTNSLSCENSTYLLQNFVQKHRIDVVLYKGGTKEKSLCNEAGVPSINIETLGAPRVRSHNPQIEVHAHYNYLSNIHCIPEN